MKKYILKILLLFALVAVGDILFGICMKHVYGSIKSGGQGRNNYIANEMKADLVVFGSSRALCHYNTKLLQDSLGVTCFNCGENGNGILLDYGRLWMLKKRYTPKIIIVDITPSFDLLKSKDGMNMEWLRPFYDKDGIKEIFQDLDSNEKYKMLSSCYKYNSFFFMRIASYLLGGELKNQGNGFIPNKGIMRPKKKGIIKDLPIEYDSLKIGYLNKFINLASDSKLYFIISPVWYDMRDKREEEIASFKTICENKGIPLIDFTNDLKFIGNDSLFHNGTHLNSKGADEFSKDIVRIIRQSATH